MGTSGIRLLGMQRVDLKSRSRTGGAFTRSMQQQDPKKEASFEKIDTARYLDILWIALSNFSCSYLLLNLYKLSLEIDYGAIFCYYVIL